MKTIIVLIAAMLLMGVYGPTDCNGNPVTPHPTAQECIEMCQPLPVRFYKPAIEWGTAPKCECGIVAPQPSENTDD